MKPCDKPNIAFEKIPVRTVHSSNKGIGLSGFEKLHRMISIHETLRHRDASKEMYLKMKGHKRIPFANFVIVMVVLTCLVLATLFHFGYMQTTEPTVGGGEDSLQLVHVIFRHGERTPTLSTVYPNDPYKDERYYPYGMGQLTKEGKLREYRIGKALRYRYDNFLGKLYEPDVLQARSTDVSRTKVSLQLVLAGLYPPIGDQKVDSLNWQPIPYEAEPEEHDHVLYGVSCPNYKKFYQQHINSESMQKEFEQHQELFRFLSKKSGWNITSYEDIFFLYYGLRTEKEWGLELPAWTDGIYPKVLEDIVIREYSVATANTPLKSISVGYHLKKILEDSKAKVSRTLKPADRKIFLYSVHEWNIAYLLSTLDVFDQKIPSYGCYILIELHKINGEYGIKLFYEDYEGDAPKLLQLPGCNEFCPINQFAALLEAYIPSEDMCGRRRKCDKA